MQRKTYPEIRTPIVVRRMIAARRGGSLAPELDRVSQLNAPCRIAASLLCSCLLLAARAEAATCTIVSVTSLAFGAYDVYAAAPVDSAGTINYDCVPANAPVGIALSAGNSGSFNPRQMSSGANALGYNIYVDAARTIVWTSTPVTGGSSGCEGQCGNGVYISYYGRIFAQQDATVGAYSDTVTVTINF
jgi:spore coat protein U-like protein